jgi:hypothetical protein
MNDSRLTCMTCTHVFVCSLGGLGDAVVLAKRMELSREGKNTCADVDEECAVEEWL